MPSMNHSGIVRAAGALVELIRPWPVIANWKACTSSCPSTWSVSARDAPTGITMRRL
jgi:hypothetical protein